MNSTDTYWEVDGESLQTYAYNIVSWGGDREAPPQLRGSDITIPYAPGATWMSRQPDSRTVTLGMWVVGANEDGSIPQIGSTQRELFERNWRMLRKLLWTPRRQIAITKRFRLFGDSTIHTATAKGQFVSGLNPTMNGQTRAAFTVDILLSDPYFYGDPIELELNPQDPIADYEILGDDRTMRIETEITGFTKKLRITNEVAEELWFEYDRELATGRKAIIRNAEFEATHDVLVSPVPSSGSVNHKGDPFWMYLEPGINRIGIQEMDVPSQGVQWTNRLTNPSMETVSGSSILQRNIFPDPSLEYPAASTTLVWRRNLARNPRCTTNATYWNVDMAGGDWTGARVATGGPSGISPTYYRISNTSITPANPTTVLTDSSSMPVSAGEWYTLSAYMMATKNPVGGARAVIYWQLSDYENDWTELGPATPLTANVWARRSMTVQAPQNALYAIIGFQFVNPSNFTTSDTAGVTAVLFENATKVLPFFDGDSTTINNYDASWVGTAYNSESVIEALTTVTETNLIPNSSFENGAAVARTENNAVNSSAELVDEAVINEAADGRAADGSPTHWGVGAGDDQGGGLGSGGINSVASGGPLPQAPSYGDWILNPYQYNSISYITKLSPGQRYEYSYYAYTTGTGITLRQDVGFTGEANSSDVERTEVVFGVLTPDTWTRVTGTFTVPKTLSLSTTTVSAMFYRTSGTWANPTEFRMSAVMITKLGAGDTPTYPEYFDGSMADADGFGYDYEGNVATGRSIKYLLSAKYVNEATNPRMITSTGPFEIRRNLLKDPRGAGTEWITPSGTAGTWTKTNPTTGNPISPAGAFSHARFTCTVVPTASPTSVRLSPTGATGTAVVAGTTYTFSVYVNQNFAGGTQRIDIGWYTAAGALISSDTTGGTPGAANTWARVSKTLVAPATAAFASFLVSFSGINSIVVATNWIAVGAGLVEAVAAPLPYFDGLISDYGFELDIDFTKAWTGTAHASASTISAPRPASIASTGGTSVQTYKSNTGLDDYGQSASRAMSMSMVSTAIRALDVDIPTLLANTTYTIKFTISNHSVAAIGRVLDVSLRPVKTTSGGAVALASLTLSSPSADGMEYTYTVTTTATTPTAPAIVFVSTSPVIGDLFSVTNVLVTKVPAVTAPYRGPFFDGSNVYKGRTISRWLGTANASTSEAILLSGARRTWLNKALDPTLTAVNAGSNEVRRNHFTQPDFANTTTWLASGFGTSGSGTDEYSPGGGGPFNSGMSFKTWTAAGTGTSIGWSSTAAGRLPAAPGVPVTVSAYFGAQFNLPIGMRVGIRFLTSAGSAVGSFSYGTPVNLVAKQAHRISHTATPPATATQYEVTFQSSISYTFPQYTSLWFSAPLAEWSPILEPFFWGGKASNEDGYAYGWNGTAGNSTSKAMSDRAQTRVNYMPVANVLAGTATSAFVQVAGGGTAALSINSGAGRYTPYFLRQTYSVAATAASGVYQQVAVVGSTSYSTRASLRSSRAGDFRLVVEFLNGALASVGSYISSTYTVAANAWTDITFENLTSPATAAFVRLNVLSVTGILIAGDTLDVDSMQITPSRRAGNFISGDLPPIGDFSTEFVASLHREYSRYPAISWDGSSGVLGYGALSSTGISANRKSLEYYNENAGETRMEIYFRVKAGKVYTIRAKGQMPTGTYAATSRMIQVNSEYAPIVPSTVSSNVIPAGSTGTASLTFTAGGTGTVGVRLYNGLDPASSALPVRWGDFEFMEDDAEYTGPFNSYYDGSTTEWDVSPDSLDSMSYTAVSPRQPVAMTPAPDATVGQSSDWAAERAHSVEIIPHTASSETYVELGNGAAVMQSGLVAGNTYTFIGTINLDAPLAGTLSPYARTLTIVTRVGAGSQVFTSSTPVANAAGTTEIRFTFQIPAGSTEAAVRLYNGASIGNGVVRWDKIMIVPVASASVPYAEGYFDGSSSPSGDDFTYTYDGAKDQSASNQMSTIPAATGFTYAVSPSASINLSDVFVAKGKSLRVRGTSTTLNNSYVAIGGDSGALRLGMTAGSYYFLRVNRYLSAPLTGTLAATPAMPVVTYRIGAGSYVNITPTAGPNTAGNHLYTMFFQLPAGTTEAFISLYNGSMLGGGSVWYDNFMLQQVSSSYDGTALEYFDGDVATDGDVQYQWSGTARQSTSQRVGLRPNMATTANGILVRSNAQRGETCMRVRALNTLVGAESYVTIGSNSTMPMANSTQYLLRARVTLTAPLTGTLSASSRKLLVVWSTGTLTPTFEQVVPNSAGSYDYVALVTTPATGTLTTLRAYNGSKYNNGDVFFENIMVTPDGFTDMTFFDGNTTDTVDFDYAWAGVENQSISTLSADSVAGMVGSNAAAVRSVEWEKTGSYSAKIIPLTTSTNDTGVSIGGSNTAAHTGNVLQAGKTYTVVANVRLSAPLSGTLMPSIARTLQIAYNTVAGWTGATSVYSTQTPNAAGEYELRLTGTIPANATWALVRFVHGGFAGSGSVWIDSVAVLETDGNPPAYGGPYFDGDTASTDYAEYEWTGTPHASTSIVKGLATQQPVLMRYQPAWL